MVNYDKIVVAALKTVLPTYDELSLDNQKHHMPCISYQNITNNERYHGNTLGYSDITYRIKIWVTDLSEIADAEEAVDEAMVPTYLHRTATNQLVVGGVICQILDYSGLAKEVYTTTR